MKIILRSVQTYPGQSVFPRHAVFVIWLVHMPQESNIKWIGQDSSPPCSLVQDRAHQANIGCLVLSPQMRKEDHLANRGLVRQQHHQAIDADAQAASWGHTKFEG